MAWGHRGSCTIARIRYRRPWRWVPRWLGATGVGADQGRGCTPNEGGGAPLCSAEMRRAGTRTRFDGEFWLRKRSRRRRPWRRVPRWLGGHRGRGRGCAPNEGGGAPLCSAEMRRAGTRARFDGEFWLRKRSRRRRPWRCVPRWLGATGAVADRGGGALPTEGGCAPVCSAETRRAGSQGQARGPGSSRGRCCECANEKASSSFSRRGIASCLGKGPGWHPLRPAV